MFSAIPLYIPRAWSGDAKRLDAELQAWHNSIVYIMSLIDDGTICPN